MQKLDLTENILELRGLLKSEEIVELISSLPNNQPMPHARNLTPLIIESKSNYDKIDPTGKKFEILQSLNAANTYNEKNIEDLISAIIHSTIQNQHKVYLFLVNSFLDFYSFHYSLINISSLCQNVLFRDSLTEIHNDDTIVFRILSTDELDLSRYKKILSTLLDLIEIIQKIFSEEHKPKAKIILLDSGSDTNIGVRTSTEVTKSLFQIFKEIWDWVVNRKFYNSKLRNAGLLDNLNVMLAIKEAQDKGLLDDQTAKAYRETIIRRTDDLLELNVIPKELFEIKTENNTRKLLSEFSEVKMLENKGNQPLNL